MTPPTLNLARRAVACKGWRWMPGMRWTVTRTAPLEDYSGRIQNDGRRASDGPGLPDLSDPATLGCLLTLVREAYGRPDAYIAYQEAPEQRGWALVRAGRVLAVESTEADALVAALEAAPAAGGAR